MWVGVRNGTGTKRVWDISAGWNCDGSVAGITDDAWNRGALAIIGAKLEIENTNHKAYTDFRGTYQSESNKTAPVIAFIGTHLQSGICVVPDFVRAVDYAGNELPIKIISIIDESGAELISNYSQDTGKISFAPGIYTLSVSAEDGNNRTKNGGEIMNNSTLKTKYWKTDNNGGLYAWKKN